MRHLTTLSIGLMTYIVSLSVFADPMYTSINHYTLHKDSVSATSYISAYEVEYLIQELLQQKHTDLQSIFQYKDVLFEYLKNNIQLFNNREKCKFIAQALPVKEDYILLSEGFEFQYTFLCSQSLENLELKNILFTSSFNTQINKQLFFQQNGINFDLIQHRDLTAENTSIAWNINEENDVVIIDSDKDGLSDTEELSYKTDPNNSDTDADYYSDFEEVQNDWNPLSAEPGAFQKLRIPQEIESVSLLEKILQFIKTFF